MKQSMIGKKTGLLTVESIDGLFANCVCRCGNKIRVWKANLYRNNTKSCGCIKNSRHTNGLSKKIPEYNVWANMIRRCFDPKDKSYSDYGARGIRVCDEWRNSFAQFLADMGKRPSRYHTIERENNNGNYCPENCCWLPLLEQNHNTRRSRKIEFRGETHPLSVWARKLGFPYQTLLNRINRLGWPVEYAFTTTERNPPKIGRQMQKPLN